MKQGVLTEHDAFIMGAKETIIEMIGGQPNADQIREFILKEADDNQVMSLLLIQEMPTDVNDYTLTEDYKTLLESDIICETQYFTNENYKSFLDEVGGLVDGYESILESVLAEDWEGGVGRQAPGAKYAKAARSAEKSTIKGTENLAAGGLAKLRQQILNALARVGRKVSRIPGNIWNMAKSAYGRSIKAGQSVGSAIGRAMGSVGNFIRNAGRAAKGFGKGVKYGATFGKDTNKAVSGAARAGSRVGAAAKAVKGGAKSAGAATVKGAGAVKTAAMKSGGAIKTAAKTAGKFVAGHVKPLGAAAGVALAAGASYKAYQQYFSAAAKACAGKAGDAKAACLKLAREKAKAASHKAA